VNFDFSSEFNRAIEAKVTAEQEALRAEKELERVKFEALQAEEKAKGEAAAVLAKAEAESKSMEMRLEFAKPELVLWEAFQKWDGKAMPNTIVLGGSTDVVPMFNIKE